MCFKELFSDKGGYFKVPVRQWVLSIPKRLRYFLHHNPKVTSKVLGLFLDEIRKQILNIQLPVTKQVTETSLFHMMFFLKLAHHWL